MTKKLARRPPPAVTVPGGETMDDETLYKHLNARHRTDLGLTIDMHYSPLYSKGLVEVHRSYHRRMHDLATPSQYDHEHVGEN